MAKMTYERRRVTFENALMKIFGDRFETERDGFMRSMDAIAERIYRRLAEEDGIDFNLLNDEWHIRYCSLKDTIWFRDSLRDDIRTSFDFDTDALRSFDAELPVILIHETPVFYYKSEKSFPAAVTATAEKAEEAEIAAVYRKYAAFLNEVLKAAVPISDVLCAASSTSELERLSPVLAGLAPKTERQNWPVSAETLEKVNAIFADTRSAG